MKKRWYVGVNIEREMNRRTPFLCAFTPSFESHGGEYNYVMGPFVTKAGAFFMADYGEANPHCHTVADAERLAKMGVDKEHPHGKK